jgi:hypothetical protein
MQRRLKQLFRSGDLHPRSELIEIKHIGPYLYQRLKNMFAPRLNSLSIRRFASQIKNLSLFTLKHKLQKALQNQRNNQCIMGNKGPHHVRDYNEKGYEALISLIKVLAKNEDGHNLGRQFTFDATQLRMPNKRSEIAKHIACHGSRSKCRRRGGSWSDNQCNPPNGSINGFPGVFPFSGQETYDRNLNKPLGSKRNAIRRGSYSKSRNSRKKWRRPGSMNHVT